MALAQDQLVTLAQCRVGPANEVYPGGIKQRRVAIDEPPQLAVWQQRCRGAQVRARAAPQIDDADRVA